MAIVDERLEFLDKEIERAKGVIKEITAEYKTAMAEAKNSSDRKEEFEFLKGSFQTRITDATRRLSTFEEFRMNIVLEDLMVSREPKSEPAGSRKKTQKPDLADV
jgi:predicted  nucleic acid-binding Zn-ribbon protein